MLGDYVRELYVPTARTSTALSADHAAADSLALWKSKVRTGWPHVHIDHVEASGLGDSVEIGQRLHVEAFVSLGDLDPEDVCVEIVHGRAGDDDTLSQVSTTRLPLRESYERGRHSFGGDVVLDRTGSFGYSVRVLPHHELLAAPAELALVVWPDLAHHVPASAVR
jgi:starch phosphorylase